MSSQELLLDVVGLSKRFGGLAASDNVSLSVHTGEIHAVIGPNGAGKTTLIAQLQGEVMPDSGAIWFDGREITRLAPHQRAAIGIARSFQITSVFMDMTVLDNAALAIQAIAGHSFHFWRSASSDPRLRAPAMAAIERVGLGNKADFRVAHLSHGQRRQLELAMAIASRPKLLLLDEPLAGRIQADGRARARPEENPHHSARRARYPGGVFDRRQDHRLGIRPNGRNGYARAGPDQSWGTRGISRRRVTGSLLSLTRPFRRRADPLPRT